MVHSNPDMIQLDRNPHPVITANTTNNSETSIPRHSSLPLSTPEVETSTELIYRQDQSITLTPSCHQPLLTPLPAYCSQDPNRNGPIYHRLIPSSSSSSSSSSETLKNPLPSSKPSSTHPTLQGSPSYPFVKSQLYHPHPHHPQSSPPPSSSILQRFKTAVRDEIQDFKQASREIIHFIKHHDWKSTLRAMFQRKYWGWWILGILVFALSSLLSSHHTQIAMYLKPYQDQIRKASWSWIIPTILLIIVSFPPLFGHELIILVAGMVWGLWIGFAIACAGTFLGELATYFAFKHMISQRSQKIEERSVTYATLAKLMRDGGLSMVILVRASAMPGHVCTAMQATIGIGFWIFAVACFVTLPKQFALVYVGVMLGDPSLSSLEVDRRSSHDSSTSHHAISAAVFLATAFFTIISAYIVWMRMRKLRPIVKEEFERRTLSKSLSEHHDLPSHHHPPSSSDLSPSSTAKYKDRSPSVGEKDITQFDDHLCCYPHSLPNSIPHPSPRSPVSIVMIRP